MSGITMFNQVITSAKTFDEVFNGLNNLQAMFSEASENIDNVAERIFDRLMAMVPQEANKLTADKLAKLQAKIETLKSEIPVSFTGIPGMGEWELFVQYELQKQLDAGKVEMNFNLQVPQDELELMEMFGMNMGGLLAAADSKDPVRVMSELGKLLRQPIIEKVVNKTGYGSMFALLLTPSIAKNYH